eukprot:873321-Amphidinium_carterae.1
MACTVLTDYWRLHFIATRPGTSLLVAVLHTCILRAAARFYGKHVTWGQPAKHSSAGTEPTRWQRLLSLTLTSSRVHRLWFWACVLAAAPGVVYSTVKAVSQADELQHVKASARAASNPAKPSKPLRLAR